MKVKICKFLLASVGKILPLRRHLGGSVANKLRCLFVKGIISKMGINCIVESGAEVMEGCVFGDGTSIGQNCMIGPQSVFEGYAILAPNVRIYTVNHLYDKNEHRFNGRTEPNAVIIGEHVWIGYGVIVLPGVTIGSHTIIGAGSVVAKDVPSGVVAAGNPCAVKKILDEDFYEELH